MRCHKSALTAVNLFRFRMYSGKQYLVPNLCFAHRVCQHYDRLPVRDEPCAHCQSLGPRRHVFRGPHTLKEIVDWLFQTQPHPQGQASCLLHQDAIVIAHNFKGYDGQF